MKYIDQNLQQIERASKNVLPAVIWSGTSEKWWELLDKIMSLYKTHVRSSTGKPYPQNILTWYRPQNAEVAVGEEEHWRRAVQLDVTVPHLASYHNLSTKYNSQLMSVSYAWILSQMKRSIKLNTQHFIELEGSLTFSQEQTTCPCPGPDQSSPHTHPLFGISILILSSHLWPGLPMVSFPHLSQPQLYLSCHPYMTHFPHISFFCVVRGTDNEAPTISLWSPNILLSTILRHPQTILLHQLERSSFTSMQHKRQNYSTVYCSLYIFGQQIGRQKILDWMVTGTPRNTKFM